MLRLIGVALLFLASVSSFSYADGDAHSTSRADSHAPIGVMGDHVHKQGEWMFSYRYMTMSMSGNLQGSDDISDDAVASSPNTFADRPMNPPVLRIVPQDMSVTMHMLGGMYAPSDWVTLMLMVNHVEKDMTLFSYSAMMNVEAPGDFTTKTSGWSDTKFSALISAYSSPNHKVHYSVGLSLPTGSIKEEDTILTPMNMRPTVRLPYAMQLGTGSYHLEPAFTYAGSSSSMSWGAQYKMSLPLDDNSEGYKVGDLHQLTAWTQYSFAPSLSVSLRSEYKNRGEIDGADDSIVGPVQTADPQNYGGTVLDLGLGVTLLGQEGLLKGHRLAAEYSEPVMQDVNGIQMKMESMITLGYQYAF